MRAALAVHLPDESAATQRATALADAGRSGLLQYVHRRTTDELVDALTSPVPVSFSGKASHSQQLTKELIVFKLPAFLVPTAGIPACLLADLPASCSVVLITIGCALGIAEFVVTQIIRLRMSGRIDRSADAAQVLTSEERRRPARPVTGSTSADEGVGG